MSKNDKFSRTVKFRKHQRPATFKDYQVQASNKIVKAWN